MPKTRYEPCELPGCDGAQVARGHCWKHYQRLRAHGSPRRFATQYVTAPEPCGVDGCGRPTEARSLCKMHYTRWLRYGSTADPRPSFEESFWDKIDKNGPVVRVDLGPCHMWVAARDSDGYGKFRGEVASRVALRLAGRPVPDDLEAAHSCDNPPCVNAEHLQAVTHADNMADMARKGRHRMSVGRGEDNPAAKLTDDEVAAIRDEYARGDVSQRELASRYGVSQRQVGRIVSGEHRAPPGDAVEAVGLGGRHGYRQGTNTSLRVEPHMRQGVSLPRRTPTGWRSTPRRPEAPRS